MDFYLNYPIPFNSSISINGTPIQIYGNIPAGTSLIINNDIFLSAINSLNNEEKTRLVTSLTEQLHAVLFHKKVEEIVNG